MREKFLHGIAVGCGIVLGLCVVLWAVTDFDQSTGIMLAVMAVLYGFFLLKFSQYKKKRKTNKEVDSPLQRRR